AFGLRDLVLVVRELQVLAAAVDVERLAEQRAAHRGALDVPAGPALAPGRWPGRLAGLGALPQHEIERILLRLVDVDALARAQLVERLAGKLSVTGKAAHRVVHIPRLRLVGELLLLQPADQLD